MQVALAMCNGGRRKAFSLAQIQSGPYTISEVAEALSVSPLTLRSWERRYGLLAPARTAGNHRRYSDEDVDRLTVFVALSQRRRAKESAALLKEMDTQGRV